MNNVQRRAHRRYSIALWRSLLVLLFLLSAIGSGRCLACDVCGSSASGQYLGLLPQANSHFAGLQYQFRSFRSVQSSLIDNKPIDSAIQHYQTYQLWGRAQLGNRLQVFVFLPYQYNELKTDTGHFAQHGMGDITLMLAGKLLNNTGGENDIKHNLLVGGGVKLPTGGYSGVSVTDRLGLPNMQPGTGSWDFVVNTNYTISYQKVGLNFDGAYTITTPNSSLFKYGNRLATGVTGFYQFQQGSAVILPLLGARYEYALHDYDNYSRKWLNERSGGYQSFATAGVQAYFGKIGGKIACSLPVAQNISDGQVNAKGRAEASVLFIF